MNNFIPHVKDSLKKKDKNHYNRGISVVPSFGNMGLCKQISKILLYEPSKSKFFEAWRGVTEKWLRSMKHTKNVIYKTRYKLILDKALRKIHYEKSLEHSAPCRTVRNDCNSYFSLKKKKGQLQVYKVSHESLYSVIILCGGLVLSRLT